MKLRILLILGAVVAISGCGSLVGAQSSCSAANQTYLAMWDCIKGRVGSGNAGLMNNAQGVRYMAQGDAIAEQVRNGAMTDAQAKAALAVEMEQGNAAFNRERRADAPITCNRFGTTVTCY